MASPGSATDDLVRDAVGGGPEAIDALNARVAPRVLSYVRMRMGPSLRTRMDSRDILQATLLEPTDLKAEQLRCSALKSVSS